MNKFRNWFPALIMMLIIYSFSSQPSNKLPNFGNLDYFLKKSGHAIGYALLAISYFYALNNKKYFSAWLLAFLFALTDEYHQSFVQGRFSSIYDVIIFDNFGALIGLGIWSLRERYKKYAGSMA